MTPGAAIAWILINLAVPFLGVPLYFLFGDFRIRGYVRRHRAAAAKLEEQEETAASSDEPTAEQLPEAIAGSVAEFRGIFSKFGPMFRPQWGKVDLLVDGESTFEAIFSAIENATSYILVQYYILRSDRLGLELKRLLMAKAMEGVPVFLLYDDMGSFWLGRDYIRDLKHAGVRVESFLPIASFKRFFQLNFRNHRKLVVVDGAQAFTGGLNVGEEYAARRVRRRKSLKRYWRDTHVRITGAAVAEVEDIFLEDWYFATGDKVDLDAIRRRAPTPEPPPEAFAPRDTVVQIIPTGPTDDTLVSLLFLMQLINSAKKRLWIATPYFVPDHVIIKSLELAALRGVDVRLILPRVSDNPLVHWVSLSYAELMQSRGVLVLLYEAGFMHQKVILADEHLSVVGTMNIDNRALYLNFETMVLIHGTEFNAGIERMLQRDFLTCRFLQKERHPLVRRLTSARANLARLLAPLL
jgi:cardiolipin synthase